MSRKQRVMLAALASAAAFVVWLAMSSRQPPVLPADETHAAWDGAATCLTCHGPGGVLPQKPKHPLGADCLRCHGRR